MNYSHTLATLDSIALDTGGFAMVAMDQRESLRSMFDTAGAGRPDDSVLIDFKMAVAETLGPLSSGLLIDRHYGFETIRDEGILPASSGLILAADDLTQEDGGPVEETGLDTSVLDGTISLDGVSALKLLVIWRRDEKRESRIEMATKFADICRKSGLISVLEPVVRAAPRELSAGTWNTEIAIKEAARELSRTGQDLYKVQVPLGGSAEPPEQQCVSDDLARNIAGPWVVLSQGVARERFAASVLAACRAGASGFLAGRALWSDIVGQPEGAKLLSERAVPRLERLREIVEESARPWSEV